MSDARADQGGGSAGPVPSGGPRAHSGTSPSQTGADGVRQGEIPVRLGLVIGQLTYGGAERQLWHLCRGLVGCAGVKPQVYCLSDKTEPYGSSLRDLGVPVRVLSGGRLRRVRMLRRWLQRDRINVVHAWLFIANAYAWLANRAERRPLLTSARNCKRQGVFLDLMNRRAFAASLAIVTNAAAVRDYIGKEYAAPTARTLVIPNAVDTVRFRPNVDPEDSRRGPVVSIGRLVAQKNHDLFLRAAARLRAETGDAHFLIVGEGPLRASLEAEAARLGLGACLSFAGQRDDVDAILRRAAVLWLTSGWEGLPNVVLEAMASGVPVIATDVGGASELVRPGVEGFLVGQGDVDAFVHHSARLLADGETWQRFSAAARARAEEFSEERMVERFVELYRACRRGDGNE